MSETGLLGLMARYGVDDVNGFQLDARKIAEAEGVRLRLTRQQLDTIADIIEHNGFEDTDGTGPRFYSDAEKDYVVGELMRALEEMAK